VKQRQGGAAESGARGLVFSGEARRVFLVAVPPALLAAWFLAAAPNTELAWSGFVLAMVGSLLLARYLGHRERMRLRALGGVVSAYRENDFSIRARTHKGPASFVELGEELNLLGDHLRRQRLDELEAWVLLRKVLAEVDVVVLAFDENARVKLVNRGAEKLLSRTEAEIIGRSATDLALPELLTGKVPRLLEGSLALAAGAWELRRGSFRMSGAPHTLVVLSDVGSVLREQERDAYKRLIRVMGHEINNSLAPIQSIADNLKSLVERSPLPEDWQDDVSSGLSIVARRAEGLGRFMASYAKLARLPQPVLEPLDVETWVRRVAGLEQRLVVEVLPGPRVELSADAGQLDQLLINLVKNATEASLECQGSVRIGWAVAESTLVICVEDDGPGVSETANLFVPFFTTKQGGSGIGLALSRQIAEGHGGQVQLGTRPGGKGAQAIVRLPIGTPAAVPRALP
jgi:two-component system, NtrC family, nitrogen regulation sensor histidine kinase NtrY